VPHAPHIAVTATPWPGTVAVYSSASDNGYKLNRLIAASATIGLTQSTLQRAAPALWDRGEPLRVKVYGGALSSVTQEEVLNGANVMAIGDGSGDVWELFQFATATPIEPLVYDLSLRLRGQLGSDALMPETWPPGSQVVMINTALEQIDLSATERGLARNYRIGAAQRGYDDPSYVHLVQAFQGIGLRPYAPAHLRVNRAPSGNLQFGWIRRTRVDGDSWSSIEVPLAEEAETYLVQVQSGTSLLRETVTSVPNWTYSLADQAADAASGTVAVRVAQVSARFGSGLFKIINVAL